MSASSTLPVVTPASPEESSPRTERVTHLFLLVDERIARQMGTEVQMLCGIWGWTGTWTVTTPGPRPGRCASCSAVLDAIHAARAGKR